MDRPCKNSLQNIKATLRSLINSKNRGMTLSDLERDYMNMEGRQIPFVELGYTRLETFLGSLTDTLVCKKNGSEIRVFAVQCANSTHIAQLVRQQKPPKNSQPQRRNFNQGPQYQPVESQMSRTKRRTRGQQSRPLLNTPCDVSNGVRQPAAVVRSTEKRLDGRQPQMPAPIKSPLRSETTTATSTTTTRPRDAENIAPADILSISSNSSEYIRQALDKPLAAEMRTPCSRSPSQIPSSRRAAPSTSGYVVKKPFARDHLLQNTAMDRISSDLARVHVQQPSIAPPAPVVVAPEPTLRSDWALPELSDDDPLFMMDLPASVAKFDAVVPAAQLPDILGLNSVFMLNVTEVNSPTKFWFHVQNDNHPLDKLMDKLENFYNSISLDNLPMRSYNAVPGLLCAARFNGAWHRAMVVERYKPDKTVKVHYFDYGTTVDTPLTDIRYLLLVFAELPVQAHRGVLDGVLPINNRWCRESFDTFHYFVYDMMLYGRITRFQPEDRSLRLVLVNTVLSDVDVILHEVLLQRNLARPRCSASKLLRSEMYPTFEMLETGKYPSYTEIDIMHQKGFDYEEFLDSLVKPLDFINRSAAARPLRQYHPSNPFAQAAATSQHPASQVSDYQPVRDTNPFRVWNVTY